MIFFSELILDLNISLGLLNTRRGSSSPPKSASDELVVAERLLGVS